MTDEKQRALELARRIANGWNGRFFYDEERGDIAYIAADCDDRQCDCEVKYNSDGDQDCSVSLIDVDDAGHDIAAMLNVVRPLLGELERCRAVCEAATADRNPLAPERCPDCNWCNTNLMNYGQPESGPVWLCHGCAGRRIRGESPVEPAAIDALARARAGGQAGSTGGSVTGHPRQEGAVMSERRLTDAQIAEAESDLRQYGHIDQYAAEMIVELRDLRREVWALRSALISVCDDAVSFYDDRIKFSAFREAANMLAEPFSFDKVQRLYDERRTKAHDTDGGGG